MIYFKVKGKVKTKVWRMHKFANGKAFYTTNHWNYG